MDDPDPEPLDDLRVERGARPEARAVERGAHGGQPLRGEAEGCVRGLEDRRSTSDEV
ncbi:MAG: hypothetical protein IPM79_05055 [Polyangiaceae bacterium]|nr:hypothetical protein [Polyangiaceae bacterium]